MAGDKKIAALTKCYVCGEASDILISKRLADMSKYDGQVVTKEPCSKCKETMKTAIILISVKDGSDKENPFRTGGWVAVKKEAEFLKSPAWEPISKFGIGFIEDSVWKAIGLPLSPYQESSLG